MMCRRRAGCEELATIAAGAVDEVAPGPRGRQPPATCVCKKRSTSEVRVSVMSASEMVGVPSPGWGP